MQNKPKILHYNQTSKKINDYLKEDLWTRLY